MTRVTRVTGCSVVGGSRVEGKVEGSHNPKRPLSNIALMVVYEGCLDACGGGFGDLRLVRIGGGYGGGGLYVWASDSSPSWRLSGGSPPYVVGFLSGRALPYSQCMCVFLL